MNKPSKLEAILSVVLVVLAFTFLCALITTLVWNLALVSVVATCGGTIGKISFLQGLGVWFILNMLHYNVHDHGPGAKKD